MMTIWMMLSWPFGQTIAPVIETAAPPLTTGNGPTNVLGMLGLPFGDNTSAPDLLDTPTTPLTIPASTPVTSASGPSDTTTTTTTTSEAPPRAGWDGCWDALLQDLAAAKGKAYDEVAAPSTP
jgi:hypothetical protein